MGESSKSWEQWEVEFSQGAAAGYDYYLNETDTLCKSPIEKIVYMSLIQLFELFGSKNIRITPQSEVSKYTVDFLISFKPLFDTCHSLDIVIECDGHEWHEKTKEQSTKDKVREREIKKCGYLILRYSGSEIVEDPEKAYIDVANVIYSWWPRLRGG